MRAIYYRHLLEELSKGRKSDEIGIKIKIKEVKKFFGNHKIQGKLHTLILEEMKTLKLIKIYNKRNIIIPK